MGRFGVFLLAAALVPGLAVPAGGFTGPADAAGCVTGSAHQAAAALVHPEAEVVALEQVAGLRTALVHEPLMYPAVRHRLLAAGTQWCAVTAFNAAWRAARGSTEPVAVAAAYASVAAAPYFDGVTVTRSRQVAPGLVRLETHARTNGVVADWTVGVDGRGVATASWTGIDFARAPFEAQWQGLTATPGVTRTYLRLLDGSLDMVEELAPLPAAPELYADAVTPDGFTIRVSLSESQASPNPGLDTGVTPVDYVRWVRDMTLENYEQFHSWGLRKGWRAPDDGPEDLGYIYLDSSTAAICLACVYIREDFQIHMSSAVVEALTALGFSYPDRWAAFSNVIGHEMLHNFQNAYSKPEQSGRFGHFSLLEGTARFSETLHSYSWVSHQPNSLVFGTGHDGLGLEANSCNGWMGDRPDRQFSAGPFEGKTYNACYFWLAWNQKHGPEGLVGLFEALHDAIQVEDPQGQTHRQVVRALRGVGGQDGLADDLAVFARASITGKGYTWAAGDGSGQELDWGVYLQRWEPDLLAAGQISRAGLRSAGVAAREVTAGGVVSFDAPEGFRLFLVADDGTDASHRLLADGEVVEAPAEGTSHWLVAVNPTDDSGSASFALE